MSAADRRAEILACAAGIAREQGFEHVTLRSVAERSGVTPGLIVHYFAGIEELLIEVFREVHPEPTTTDGATPMAQLVQLLQIWVAPPGGPERHLWLGAAFVGQRYPALAAAVREQMGVDRELLRAVIAEGRATGVFPQGEPAEASLLILAVIDAALVEVLVGFSELAEQLGELAVVVAERELGLAEGVLRAALAE